MDNKEVLNYFKGDELATKVWADKYALRDSAGNIIEDSPTQMHERMAKEFARIEAKYGGDNVLTEQEIFNYFKDFKYIVPGGSVMAGLGSPSIGSLSNCFVIGQPEDSYSGIMKLREEQAHLMKRRGGVGKDLSTLRPAGAAVKNAAKSSTGAASFMDVDSALTMEVAQRGRRGALMLTLNIRHPDIEEFITKKQDLSKVIGANISVKLTDDFMEAVKNDEDYYLRFPIDQDLSYFSKDYLDVEYGKLVYLEDHKNNNSIFYIKRVKARELWDKLIHCAWNTAEPGIMFEDRHINYSPDGVYPQYKGVSTNPCGEIFMQPYDSCRLIHLNLTSFVDNPFTSESSFNYKLFTKVATAATRLGDDLVDLEVEALDRILGHIKNSKGHNDREIELWEAVKSAALSSRRCGIGFTGLADTIAMLSTSFNNSHNVVYNIMKTMFRAELAESINLAKERGTFAGWDREKEVAGRQNEWYTMVASEFPDLYEEMQKVGRRNVSFSTVAPTGTVSILTQTSSGIEPVFSLYYTRRKKCMEGEDFSFVDQNGEKFQEFKVFHPQFVRWCTLRSQKSYQDTIDMLNSLSAADLDAVIKKSPWYGSTAPEIDWAKRVELQSIVQHFITHSISSTLNLPNNVTEQEVSNIYLKAWGDHLKGVTVYRDGCRSGILVTDSSPKETFSQHNAPKRPKSLDAELHVVKVKRVKYAVIVGLLEGKPYETFAFELGEGNFLPQSGKIIKVKKGCYNFVGDHDLIIEKLHLANDKIEERACSIYTSMLLRHGAPIEYVISTTKKVNENIASFASAICRVLMKYSNKEIGDEVCPECGGKIVREAGCKKCNNCGYSLCLIAL